MFNVRLANLSNSAAVSVWYSAFSKDNDLVPDNSPATKSLKHFIFLNTTIIMYYIDVPFISTNIFYKTNCLQTIWNIISINII